MLISERGGTPERGSLKGGVVDIKGMALICGVQIVGYNPKNARD